MWGVPLSEQGKADAKKTPAYCNRYYYDGGYHELTEPLWRHNSSACCGVCVSMEIPMRGNVPFLWRDHYVTLTANIEEAGMDSFSFVTSDTLLRIIEVLASKNHYPQNSLMRVVVWTDMTQMDGKTEFAIFQQRLSHRAFDVVKGENIYLTLEDGNVLRLPERKADASGIGRAIEAFAHRRALAHGCNGACIVNAKGNIARTTLGNIYTIMTDNLICGVGLEDGARRDPLEASIMRIFREEGFRYEACPGLDTQTMKTATGCFVAGSAIGLRPVVSAGTDTRYYTDMAYRLADRLRSLFIF